MIAPKTGTCCFCPIILYCAREFSLTHLVGFRHVFPWIDVNVRFGFVKYATEEEDPKDWEDVEDRLLLSPGMHPSKLLLDAQK